MNYLIIFTLLICFSCNSISKEENILIKGDELAELGLYSKAIKKYNELIELNSSDSWNSSAYLEIAECYVNLDEDGKALRYLDKSIESDSMNKVAIYNRGIQYEELNRLKEAIRDYMKAAEIDPNNKNEPDNKMISLSAGISYSKIKNYNEAIKCFESIIKIDKEYADAHYSLGIVYKHQGQYEKAINKFWEALQLKPNEQAYINQIKKTENLIKR